MWPLSADDLPPVFYRYQLGAGKPDDGLLWEHSKERAWSEGLVHFFAPSGRSVSVALSVPMKHKDLCALVKRKFKLLTGGAVGLSEVYWVSSSPPISQSDQSTADCEIFAWLEQEQDRAVAYALARQSEQTNAPIVAVPVLKNGSSIVTNHFGAKLSSIQFVQAGRRLSYICTLPRHRAQGLPSPEPLYPIDIMRHLSRSSSGRLFSWARDRDRKASASGPGLLKFLQERSSVRFEKHVLWFIRTQGGASEFRVVEPRDLFFHVYFAAVANGQNEFGTHVARQLLTESDLEDVGIGLLAIAHFCYMRAFSSDEEKTRVTKALSSYQSRMFGHADADVWRLLIQRRWETLDDKSDQPSSKGESDGTRLREANKKLLELMATASRDFFISDATLRELLAEVEVAIDLHGVELSKEQGEAKKRLEKIARLSAEGAGLLLYRGTEPLSVDGMPYANQSEQNWQARMRSVYQTAVRISHPEALSRSDDRTPRSRRGGTAFGETLRSSGWRGDTARAESMMLATFGKLTNYVGGILSDGGERERRQSQSSGDFVAHEITHTGSAWGVDLAIGRVGRTAYLSFLGSNPRGMELVSGGFYTSLLMSMIDGQINSPLKLDRVERIFNHRGRRPRHRYWRGPRGRERHGNFHMLADMTALFQPTLSLVDLDIYSEIVSVYCDMMREIPMERDDDFWEFGPQFACAVDSRSPIEGFAVSLLSGVRLLEQRAARFGKASFLFEREMESVLREIRYRLD